MHSFEELEVWKAARELRVAISQLVRAFPKEERYRLVDQILRSSRSVAANIAEGFGRLRIYFEIAAERISHENHALYEGSQRLRGVLEKGYERVTNNLVTQ